MKTASALLLAALLVPTAWAQQSSVAEPMTVAAASLPESPSAVATSSSRATQLADAEMMPAVVIPALKPVAERPVITRHPRAWVALAAMQHGSAIFDAWSTRRAVRSGAPELNPLVRPFAGSVTVYPALQLMPLATDYISWKMMGSHNPVLRRFWWLPQVVGTAGSTVSGIINLGHQYPTVAGH